MKWVDSHEAAGILSSTPDYACVLAKKKLVVARKRGHMWEFADEELRAFAAKLKDVELRTGR